MTINKKKIFPFGIIMISLLAMLYISLPYIKSKRSQIAYKLELKGDLSSDKKQALLFFKKAEIIRSNESTNVKIGRIYDDFGYYVEADKYFEKTDPENPEILRHYFKKGDLFSIETFLSTSGKPDTLKFYRALLTSIDKPTESLVLLNSLNEDEAIDLKSQIEKVIRNPDQYYTSTAIAQYLYNNGYKNFSKIKLVEISKDNKQATVLLGDIYYQEGLYNKSAIAYLQSIKLDPYDIGLRKSVEILFQDKKIDQRSDLDFNELYIRKK